MSEISLHVSQSSDAMAVVRCLRPLIGQSIAEIREAVGNGSPLLKHELFLNDHNEIAEQLRHVVTALEQSDISFEVYEDEHLISADILRNILDAYDRGMGRGHR
jgi:hypothetical protein